MAEIQPIKETDYRLLNELLGEVRGAIRFAGGIQVGRAVPATSEGVRWLVHACGDGAIALYEDDRLVGVCFVHTNGSEAWLGPFGVFENEQGKGHGRQLLQGALDYVTRQTVSTIGLEAPASPWLLGFLGRTGFSPSAVALSLEIPVAKLPQEMDFWVDQYSALEEGSRERVERQVRDLADAAAPGRNYLPLMKATAHTKVGETMLFSDKDELVGMMVCHKVPFFQGEAEDAIRVPLLLAHIRRNVGRLDQLITACGAYARVNERKYVRLQCDSSDPVTYQYLLSRGFRVRSTSVRLTLEGYHENRMSGYALLSTWDI